MESPCAVFDFRANEDFGTCEEIRKWMSGIAKSYVFQKEQGDNGYIHWQGRLSLMKKRRLGELKKLLTTSNRKLPNYLQPTTAGVAIKGEMFYAIKEDTRLQGPFSDKDEQRVIPRQVREMSELYPWQQQIVDDADKWDKRTINLVYCPEGNQGKSSLVGWCRAYQLARCLPPVNECKDLLRMVCDMPISKMYLFDMPRSMNKDRLHGFYSAVETIKDGYAYDDRYAFKEIVFDCPNIWIFSNILPDLNSLSSDRWKIWNIKEKQLIKYEEPKFNEL